MGYCSRCKKHFVTPLASHTCSTGEVESLRQQLAEANSEVERKMAAGEFILKQLAECQAALADTEALEIGTGERLAKVTQQLVECQAALMLKDEALSFDGFLPSDPIHRKLVQEALAIRPGTEALEKWLGEPVCLLAGISSERNPPHGWAVTFTSGEVPLYAKPKGLK